MAKGKHSPALFEVVHGKRRFDPSASILRTPNWWFKGRHRGPAAPVMEAEERPAFTDESDPTLRGIPSPTAEPEPAPVTAEYETPSEEPSAYSIPQRRRGGSAFHVVVDRDRHELFVRVRYTTAIVAGFAVLVVVALAYITGRHMGRGPATALATQSSEEVASGPIEKGVLDVGGRSSTTTVSTTTTPGLGVGGVSAQPAPNRVTEASVGPSGGGNVSAPTTRQPPAPAKPADFENGKRIVGRQYVVIQAYAGNQKALAEEARDFLIKSGVSCTVEQGVSGWPSTWHSVVSTQGFDRASGPQYEAFVQQATKIGEAFAGKSAWKKFEPTPVRWK
jgi:hypothetical protein